ncbi:MAG: fructosamine kinase [Ignavibacteriales bacterium CG_4_9_14_3_um_filter_34_10]|nr:MAG: fructosamine kinase [Ignavibacteriales bacterium CG_4_9_14_3_um_filter_34_10]
MNEALSKIEKVIGQKIISSSSGGGGCIADSFFIQTDQGGKYFLKNYSIKNVSVCEAHGLIELSKANKIKIPNVIWFNENILLLEYLPTARKTSDFFETFGSQLAKLHKVTSENFGFYEDNFIGSNVQKNLPQSTDWIDFYWNNRILYQLNLADKNGYADNELTTLILRLEKVLPSIIVEEPASLIHGDLWSGNYLCDEQSRPVIIDPAVYYGNREAEFAMTLLFGGFDEKFYLAYNEVFPLQKDWKYRIDLYKLYHVLNHLNLFGMGYYSQVISILKKYVR